MNSSSVVSNCGENSLPYYWQDNHGKEIDCLLVNGERVTAVEIKSGKNDVYKLL